jgi:hypothetical protein
MQEALGSTPAPDKKGAASIVVHTFNPSYIGERDGRIAFQGHPMTKRKNFARPYLKNSLGVVVYICNPSYPGVSVERPWS